MNDVRAVPVWPDFLAARGELGGLIRTHDWRNSPLGVPEGWPEPLRTLTGVMLAAGQPMFLAWGQALTLIYNDAYANLLGRKHPAALGANFLEVWSEARHDLQPLVERVFAGYPLHMDDIALTLDRYGQPEEAHFGFSYTPVRDGPGAVTGLFCACTETTRHALAARALRESEAQATGVLQGMEDCFVLLDEAFRVAAINAAALRLEDRPREAMIGLKQWEAWPGTKDSEFGRRCQRAMRDRKAAELVHCYAWPDGRSAWIEARIYPMGSGLAIFYRDVSAARRAAASLAEREQRLRLVVESAADYAIMTIDPEGRVASWSAGAAAALGYAADEIVGRPLAILYTPEDRAAGWAMREREIAARDGAAPDVRWHLRQDGSRVFLNGTMRPLRNDDGEDIGFLKIARDETERRAVEQRLAFSEESLRLATDAAEIGTWDFDLGTGVLTWPARTKAMFGISPDTPCTMADFYAGLHPEDAPATGAAFDAALDPRLRAVYDVEYRTIGKEDRVIRWVAAKGKGLFDEHGTCLRAIGTAIDITQRKASEARLRASEAQLADSEARFRAITEWIDQMIWSTRPDGYHDFYNRRWYQYTGVAEGETDGDGWRRLCHPDDRDRVVAAWQHCLATGTLYESEYRLRNGAGVYRSVLARAVPLRDQGGSIVRWFGTSTDIQDIVSARDVLARSRAQLEREVAERTRERDRTWRNSQDLLVVMDMQGILRAANPAWWTTLGWEPHELVGRSYLDFIAPEDHPASRGALIQASREGLPRFENRYRHRDGTTRWIEWAASPEGELIYASGRDVTAEKDAAAELEAAQEQLRQSQKMEAVGQLTGGIAHDFNNLLQIVVGNLEMMQRSLPPDAGRLRRSAENAMTGARRAATLTQRLLAFSRRQPLAPKPVEINGLVRGMSDLLNRALGETIRLETALSPAVWRAEADPNQLESAILNLAVNARDAMPSGGTLTIQTANAQLDEAYAQANPDANPGQYVAISVTDTGTGIDRAILKRVFEPFFTTKEVGRGTGLGLAMVYGFARQSNGHVTLQSEPGQGTAVRIYLPRLRDASAQEVAAPASAVQGAAPSETILVVEDDDDVRAYSVEVLRELGYRVLEAADGATGLAVLEGPEGGGIGLLFTDVVLPGGLTGADVARRAAALRPSLKVLFTTGYAREAIMRDGRLDEGVELITKPFSYAELAAKVREVLESKSDVSRSL